MRRLSLSLALSALGYCALSTPARALVRMNEGRDQIFVTLTAGVSYDSNIDTAGGGRGDFTSSAGLALDYQRRAGMIGVNGRLAWNFTRFADFSNENFTSPSASLEFTKSSGRTTGSLTLSGSRDNRPDPDSLSRNEVLNYNVGLGIRYPVIERYTLSFNLDYGRTDYVNNAPGIVDLNTYAFGTDLFYTWTSERDLIFGYRVRFSETSATSESVDHAFNAGITGRILPKLNGTLRGGYQVRQARNFFGANDTFHGINASLSATWTVNNRTSVTCTLGRDYSITSTNLNTENTTLSLSGQYSVNARLSFNANAGLGQNRYLGTAGAGRRDDYYNLGTGFNFVLHPRLVIDGSFTYFNNSSTANPATFERNTVSLSATSRW